MASTRKPLGWDSSLWSQSRGRLGPVTLILPDLVQADHSLLLENVAPCLLRGLFLLKSPWSWGGASVPNSTWPTTLRCFAGLSSQSPSRYLPMETLGHFWSSRSVPAPLSPPSPKLCRAPCCPSLNYWPLPSTSSPPPNQLYQFEFLTIPPSALLPKPRPCPQAGGGNLQIRARGKGTHLGSDTGSATNRMTFTNDLPSLSLSFSICKREK